MADAYIVDAVRTAGGRRNGKLKDWHPVDMAARVRGGAGGYCRRAEREF
jgi:acetyl-CoA C-acetyltransferase